jgi:maleylacetoacetate isomerase
MSTLHPSSEYCLYGYWRSTAAYRVRIALNYKKIDYAYKAIHLVNDGGEHKQAAYAAKNPHKLVPALELDSGEVISESLAIIEFLEEQHPTPTLLPGTAMDRAKIRSIAQAIACNIHPLNNLRVLQYLENAMGCSAEQKTKWYADWIATGFSALEEQLSKCAGVYSFGDSITLADVCLIPQVYNARRFNISLDAYPTIVRIEKHCLELPVFQAASPEAQPDAV